MSASEDIVQHLLALDDERCRALRDLDLDRIDQLYSEDMILVHGRGVVETKQEFLAAQRKLEKGNDRTREGRSVRIYGDVAVMVGIQRHPSLNPPRDLMVTQVWRRGETGWQQVSYHGCALPEHQERRLSRGAVTGSGRRSRNGIQ